MVKWETVISETAHTRVTMYRAKVPGGWLIMLWPGEAASVTFYPDPNHRWDGDSLP